MKNVIQSWAFLESISPGEVPSFKNEIEASKFKDRKARNRVIPISISNNLWETVQPADEKKHEIKFRYYIDCYEQYRLVELFREYFKSSEEIVNKDLKLCFSFAFDVNSKGEYISNTLFIPHLQLIVKDILSKLPIQYSTFIDRYNVANQGVMEAANSIFSNGVNHESIQQLRQIFYEYFQSFNHQAEYAKFSYVEILLQDNRYPEVASNFNSFFLDDLQQILEKGTNATLEQFIKGKPLEIDIDENEEEIQKVLQPKNLPLGRWPSQVDHRLSFMQQVAVNKIINSNEKISSVNGPPGTGKTTLLKDVFAQLIVERAMMLAEYNHPADAFTYMGKPNINGYNYKMYKLDEKVAQYSIVVASSNNGAVENISKDLPKLKEIVRPVTQSNAHEENARDQLFIEYDQTYSEEVKELDLFIDLSSEIIQNNNTWGLFSAALGRSKNITEVSMALNGFTKNEGQPPIPSFLERLEQKLPENAWTDAVSEFNSLRKSIEQKRDELQKFATLMMEEEKLDADYAQTFVEIRQVKNRQEHIPHEVNSIKKQKELSNEQLNNLPTLGIWQKFIKLFVNKLSAEEQQIRDQIKKLIEQQKQLEIESADNSIKINQLTERLKKLKDRLLQLEQQKSRYKNQQVVLPIKEFWSKEMYEERQKSVLWQTNELNFERGLLFLKALKVQKIFLMENAKFIKTPLVMFSNRQSINVNIEENKSYLQNMWNVIHLILPVISTTFASFSSMYKGINKDFIGYLFVDEAGQASPQQAAGALWRSKRTIIVGDPIQIEPVVTLDETILHDIRQVFQVSDAYIGATASVQTLADYANPVGTTKGDDKDKQRIGIPLWVHRRCMDPMFSIANRIAYKEKMVLAKKDVGKSHWYDIKGKTVQAQYVEEQGILIVDKIAEHFEENNGKLPSIFVITPFTVVKERLKALIRERLNGKIPNLNSWVERSIGTVHTFQGKEADIVYFVTGTDADTDGAANWSCQKPNLLNVAVTRAKKEFYVVGDLERFKSKPNYDEIVQAFEEFEAEQLIKK